MAFPLEKERYQIMLESHRQEPGNLQRAATAAKANWRSAQKAWEVGWPKRGLPPIREVIEKEQRIRRALAADMEESQAAERERIKAELREEGRRIAEEIGVKSDHLKAQYSELEALGSRLEAASQRQAQALQQRGSVDAQASGAQELAWVRMVRAFNVAVLSILHGALSPRAVQRLHDQVERAALDGAMTPMESVRLARALAGMAKPMTEALKIGLEAERLAAGDPTSITRHEHHVTLEPEEIKAKLAALNRLQKQLEEADHVVDAELEEPAAAAALPEPVQCPEGAGECNSGDALYADGTVTAPEGCGGDAAADGLPGPNGGGGSPNRTPPP